MPKKKTTTRKSARRKKAVKDSGWSEEEWLDSDSDIDADIDYDEWDLEAAMSMIGKLRTLIYSYQKEILKTQLSTRICPGKTWPA